MSDLQQPATDVVDEKPKTAKELQDEAYEDELRRKAYVANMKKRLEVVELEAKVSGAIRDKAKADYEAGTYREAIYNKIAEAEEEKRREAARQADENADQQTDNTQTELFPDTTETVTTAD